MIEISGVRRPCRGDFAGEEAARGFLATAVEIGQGKVLLELIQRCCRPSRRHTTDPLTGYPQEAEVPKAANARKNRENVNEQLFVATERNAKLRYECEESPVDFR